MSKPSPPIPAFYACYLLRSTLRHASLYVGSTPNPVRRLNQHNGKTKGGAQKTSKDSLRPWEMTCLVTGFPSKVAALQFEWAWQNTHLTRHVSPTSRLTDARTSVRISPRTGRPRKRPAQPRLSLTDRLANLHLLLGSSSFRRWPLKLTFYADDVFRVWRKWTERGDVEALPTGVDVTMSVESKEATVLDGRIVEAGTGIYGLEVGYAGLKGYLEKTKAAIAEPLPSECSVCEHSLPSDGSMTLFCPKKECHVAAHLQCLAQSFTANQPGSIVPSTGSCPGCGTSLQWIDLVKELTLRMRGEKEINSALKIRKPRTTKKGRSTTATVEMDDDDSAGDDDLDDAWHHLSEYDTDCEVDQAMRSDPNPVSKFKTSRAIPEMYCEPVIEDSDWEDALVLT